MRDANDRFHCDRCGCLRAPRAKLRVTWLDVQILVDTKCYEDLRLLTGVAVIELYSERVVQ